MAQSIIANDEYEILTPSGWSNFRAIRRTERNKSFVIETEIGLLECTPEHPIKTEFGFRSAVDITIGEKIQYKEGFHSVNKITENNKNNFFYDAIDVANNNEYYTNDVVSHNCEFLGSSGTLIEGNKLKSLVPRQPIHDKNGLKMYEEPEPQHTYFCVVDVSRGKGLDYSAFHIIDAQQMPYRQVCTFRDNLITPVEYTEIIHRMCMKYNEALVLTEVNDIGAQIPDLLLFDYDYENILHTQNAGRAGKRISGGFGKKGTAIDKGIRTTQQVKSIGCSVLKLLIEQDQLIVNDWDTINELSTFSRKGVSYEAEPGCHDDLVMGLVLFGWLSAQQFFKQFTDVNTLAHLRDRTQEEIYEELLPFGIIDDGQNDMYDPGSANDWGGDADMANGKVTNWF